MENLPESSVMLGPARRPLYSVGHSNHDWDSFLALLRRAGVTAVADVRSSPYSRRHPSFNREALEHGLGAAGIAYLFLGDLLGGRPRDRALYGPDGRVDYERVRRTPAFAQGLERLVRALERQAVAMLCSEDDPRDCHRGLMITPALVERGVTPLHLRRDGSVETTQDLERSLLVAAGFAGIHEGLFAAQLAADRRADLAEAYRHRARRKAYQLPPGEDGE
jgi:uncharacterized protein (DUF488 family)